MAFMCDRNNSTLCSVDILSEPAIALVPWILIGVGSPPPAKRTARREGFVCWYRAVMIAAWVAPVDLHVLYRLDIICYTLSQVNSI